MLRSLSLGLGLETFAKFLRVSISVSKNLVSEKKSLGFGFGKIWSRKKVSVSVSEIWCRKKSLGIGFGQNFGIVIQCLWHDFKINCFDESPLCLWQCVCIIFNKYTMANITFDILHRVSPKSKFGPWNLLKTVWYILPWYFYTNTLLYLIVEHYFLTENQMFCIC